ncbi:hypothetical protein ABPG72_021792 [Tetrahymena utriculariae]
MGRQITSNQELKRERVYNFYLDNRKKGKYFTYSHFKDEHIPKSTIYRIIDRAEKGIGADRVQGSGRIAKKMTQKNIKKLTLMFDHQDGVSQRQAAKEFDCDHSYISKTLKKKTQIRAMKKQKIPDRTDLQKKQAQTKCGRLLRKYKNHLWVIDDESYFTLSHSTLNGNNNYYSSDASETPPDVKFRLTKKFEPKLLIWICISPLGISQPYFQESGLAVNQNIYLEQCIKKRIIPFIKKYHSDNNYVFWPDLASTHYANSVTTFLKKKNINFVQKNDNPANLPECRPIEDFWSILKSKVYQHNWKARDTEQLQERIELCLKKLDKVSVQNLISTIPKRLDNIRRNGVVERY